jgi:hypothetical protein
MTPSKPDHAMPLPATRLANVPLFCWLAAVALGGLVYYFGEYGHGLYRDMRGDQDYRAEARVEDACLWLAEIAATIGIITSVVGLVAIRRSAGRFRGTYRLSIGMALNLLTLLAVLFTFWVRGLLSGPNAV